MCEIRQGNTDGPGKGKVGLSMPRHVQRARWRIDGRRSGRACLLDSRQPASLLTAALL